jgi:hypothetical protein
VAGSSRDDARQGPPPLGTFSTRFTELGDVVQEPMDQAYGVRDCTFRDPAGNLLRRNQTG